MLSYFYRNYANFQIAEILQNRKKIFLFDTKILIVLFQSGCLEDMRTHNFNSAYHLSQ